MKYFNDISWPVDGQKQKMSFDAGEIVGDALRVFSKEIKIKCEPDGSALCLHTSAGYRKLKNVPCVYADAEDGKIFGGGGGEYYAIASLDSVLKTTIDDVMEMHTARLTHPDESIENLDVLLKVLDKYSAKCRKAKEKIRR